MRNGQRSSHTNFGLIHDCAHDAASEGFLTRYLDRQDSSFSLTRARVLIRRLKGEVGPIETVLAGDATNVNRT